MQDSSYTDSESYTLSFTGKCLCIKGIYVDWCRNVEENYKTILGETAPEFENTGLLCLKLPYF